METEKGKFTVISYVILTLVAAMIIQRNIHALFSAINSYKKSRAVNIVFCALEKII